MLQNCYNFYKIKKFGEQKYFFGIIVFMNKIIITATAESIEQVQALLEAGVDRIYVGEKDYGLRLPHTFSYDELSRISDLVHAAGNDGSYQTIFRFSCFDSCRLYHGGRCRGLLCIEAGWLQL